MSAEEYGKYFLISRPRYDDELRLWLPYASVWSRDPAGCYSLEHRWADYNRAFETETEALNFGFLFARQWISEHLNETND